MNLYVVTYEVLPPDKHDNPNPTNVHMSYGTNHLAEIQFNLNGNIKGLPFLSLLSFVTSRTLLAWGVTGEGALASLWQ